MGRTIEKRSLAMAGKEKLGLFSLRPATMDDLPAALEIANERDKAIIGVGTQHETHFRVRWSSPHCDLAKDSLVVETPEGRMIAFLHISCRPPFIESDITACVHPDFLGRGIGTHLLNWAERRASQIMEKAAPADARTSIEAFVLAQDERAAELMRNHGLNVIRHFVYMMTDLARKIPEPMWPAGIELRPVDRDAQDRQICLAHVEAFRDHWGHVDRSEDEDYEQWLHWIENDSELDIDLWFVAWDGDEIAGMLLCWPKGEGDPDTGYLGVLCVRRAWRGRGLGLALMQHSLRVFKDQGKPRASLHADGENITGALRLYRKVGMEIERQYDIYEKEIHPGRELRVVTLDDSA